MHGRVAIVIDRAAAGPGVRAHGVSFSPGSSSRTSLTQIARGARSRPTAAPPRATDRSLAGGRRVEREPRRRVSGGSTGELPGRSPGANAPKGRTGGRIGLTTHSKA
jgi:hypothetical protein